MKRLNISPRQNYTDKIEELGFYFYPDYWLESAYYSLSQKEVDSLYTATEECYRMYCEAVEKCFNDDSLLDLLKIPHELRAWIRDSWDKDDLSLYGRFDFAFVDGVPKLLEFNADTPTSLLEASIIQWFWKEDVFPENDQFNSIHETLVQSFKDIHNVYNCDNYVFASFLDELEDNSTVSYLAACANEAGLTTSEIDIRDITISEECLLSDGTPIKCCFKLYPWEMMFKENPYGCTANIKWLEPLWKSLMSNKAMLPILYKLFPNSPYILPAYFEHENPLKDYCKKPIFSREGCNITLVKDSKVLESTGGEYGEEGFICQQLVDIPNFSDKYPVIGSWVIGGEPCGIGIRETSTKITDNMSHFVPHIIELPQQSRFLMVKQLKQVTNPDGSISSIFVDKEPIRSKSWKQFCENHPDSNKEWYIDCVGKVIESESILTDLRRVNANLSSKEDAEGILALIQLTRLHDEWVGDWIPNFDNAIIYYNKVAGSFQVISSSLHRLLIFPTADMAKEFLECFEDLILKAKKFL